MAIIGRIFVVFLAYMLACVAASVVLAVGTLTPEWDNYGNFGVGTGAVGPLIVGIGAVFIASMALLPALLVIAIGEGFALRSSLFYGALGGVLALALTYGLNVAGHGGAPSSADAREREVLAAAGIAGGFVYWFFAGRKAGAWKR